MNCRFRVLEERVELCIIAEPVIQCAGKAFALSLLSRNNPLRGISLARATRLALIISTAAWFVETTVPAAVKGVVAEWIRPDWRRSTALRHIAPSDRGVIPLRWESGANRANSK